VKSFGAFCVEQTPEPPFMHRQMLLLIEGLMLIGMFSLNHSLISDNG